MRPRHFSLLFLLLASSLAGCAAEGDPTAAIFDRTKLHTIELTVATPYLDQLATDDETRVPCTVVYDGERIEGAGIRQKGNTLVDLSDKPSFSVKLDEFDETADLQGLNKILLNSSAQDPTLLRERIGADVFARAGIPAARIAHARVTLNGADKGIYVIAEAIDGDFLRRSFGEQSGEGNLYEGPCCGDFVDDIDHLDLEDEKKDGRTRDDVQALAQVILDAPDGDFAAAVEERLDLDRFITGYALEALLDHWDGYAYRGNNYYMYDNPVDGRFVFIPHGMDRILDDAYFDTEEAPLGKLPLRVRAIPALDEQFHAELARLVSAAWDENALLLSIDQTEGMLRAASGGAQTEKDLEGFHASVGGLREMIKLRGALIDPAIACGDGVKQGLETCDDGNATSGDGCSARCRLEP